MCVSYAFITKLSLDHRWMTSQTAELPGLISCMATKGKHVLNNKEEKVRQSSHVYFVEHFPSA
jgi:hypothetical protein